MMIEYRFDSPANYEVIVVLTSIASGDGGVGKGKLTTLLIYIACVCG